MSKSKISFPSMTENVSELEVNVTYSKNNIEIEKLKLFRDFTISLHYNVQNTYFGYEYINTEEHILGHFNWALKRTIKDYKKLGFDFSMTNDLTVVLKSVYLENFYGPTPTNTDIRRYWEDLFEYGKKRRDELVLMVRLYKIFNKSIS